MENELMKFITDKETGEKFTITQERIDRALFFVQKIQYSVLDICTSLKLLKDEKLYLYMPRDNGDIGYEYFEEFVTDKLRWGIKQVQKYIQIANSFLSSGNKEKVFALPFSVLHEMTKLPEETKEKMIESGVITLSTGEEVTLDELVEMKSKDVLSELKSLRKTNRALESTIDQKTKKHEKEIELLKKENDANRRAIDAYEIAPETMEFYKGIKNTNEALVMIHEAQLKVHEGFNRIKVIEVADVEILSAMKGFITYVREHLSDIENTALNIEFEEIAK